MALLTVFMTALFLLGGTTSANAQVERKPTWAVVDFENKGPKDDQIGRIAAQAVVLELNKRGAVDALPMETTMRAVADLGYRVPVTSASQLSRLGQQVEASTIVSGEVVNSRTIDSSGDKQAQVLVRIIVQDVASGIVINGAAISGKSGFRPGSTEASALVSEALGDAAFKGVAEIEGRRLPTSTVTSTVEGKGLLDRGIRDGLKTGMQVIVTRGRDQVAVARITSVDNDSAVVTPTQSLKGIRGGDKVRVIFDVPAISSSFTQGGDANVQRPRRSNNNAALISLVIVGLLLVVLFGGGRGGSSDVVTRVRAEASLETGLPSVKISWARDTFFRNQNIVRFQVWRNDVSTNPVAVTASGSQSSVTDRIDQANMIAYSTDLPIVGGSTTCEADNTEDPEDTTPPLEPGRPYQYSVEVVYRISALDIPGEGATGGGNGGGGIGGGGNTGGGNTGGGNTGGGNTGGGNTGGGNTGGGNTGGGTGGDNEAFCFFISARTPASGQATPLEQTALRSPDSGFPVPLTGPTAGRVNFQFNSVRGSSFGSSAPIRYIVQVSPDPEFRSRTTEVDNFVDTSTARGNTITRTGVNILDQIQASDRVYWRVGARNTEDEPGPVGGYIFSGARELRRTGTP